jgi:hypothetical protein
MIVLGAVLAVVGFLLAIELLWVVGLVLLVVGAIYELAYARPRGGRHYY